MSVLIAHPGTQYACHLARELQAVGLLHRFWTGFAVSDSSIVGSLIRTFPQRWQEKLSNRILKDIPSSRLKTVPMLEFRALREVRKKPSEDVFYERNRRFQLAIPDSEIAAVEIVVGYDTSSWILAARAKALGKRFILDQSIGHPLAKEKVYNRLRASYPQWAHTFKPKSGACLEAEKLEHELADIVVAPSGFVRDTLVTEGVDKRKIEIIPFGTDTTLFFPSNEPRVTREKMVFLFVGLINARKGIPVLLEAWIRLDPSNAELWLVGGGAIPQELVSSLPQSVKLLGRRPKPEVARLMRKANVFVFPSFFEGLAQVQVEALASGLFVISTYESGAYDLITEGVNGSIIRAGDVAKLHERLARLCEESARSSVTAANEKRFDLSWNAYGKKWCELLSVKC
jgi:glycosyltransferase involved in cell wall biosynthesis